MREINKVNSKKKKKRMLIKLLIFYFNEKKIYEWILHKVEKAFSNRKVNPYLTKCLLFPAIILFPVRVPECKVARNINFYFFLKSFIPSFYKENFNRTFTRNN